MKLDPVHVIKRSLHADFFLRNLTVRLRSVTWVVNNFPFDSCATKPPSSRVRIASTVENLQVPRYRLQNCIIARGSPDIEAGLVNPAGFRSSQMAIRVPSRNHRGGWNGARAGNWRAGVLIPHVDVIQGSRFPFPIALP